MRFHGTQSTTHPSRRRQSAEVVHLVLRRFIHWVSTVGMMSFGCVEEASILYIDVRTIATTELLEMTQLPSSARHVFKASADAKQARIPQAFAATSVRNGPT